LSNLEPRIEAVRVKYGLEVSDFWQIKQNKQWVCKHSALEIVAVKANVEWLPPMIIEKDAENLLTSMIVTGKMGDRIEWATGETNKTNYSVVGKQPAYPWAMSEKRAKDRVVLKLVGIHGLVYSEDEMPSKQDEQEQPTKSQPITSPKPYTDLIEDMKKCKFRDDMVRWWGDSECKELRAALHQDWRLALRDEWKKHHDSLPERNDNFPGSGISDASGRELHNVEG
jgi:hypothetical protein